MAEYNWDELELKYFGSDYKIMVPQEKLKITLNNIPLSSEEKRLLHEGASKLDNETAINTYRDLISAFEEIPKALSALEKVLEEYGA